jgi:hypothetical protein
MYQALAAHRRLSAEILGEMYSSSEDRVYILVAGLGAYGLLKNESGLHQVDRRYKHRVTHSNREVLREDRELIRVEVTPASHEPSAQFHKQVRTRIVPLKPAKKRIIAAEFALSVFHEPTLRSADLWTQGPKEAAIARALLILSACVESNGDAAGGDGVIRQYDLGLAAKIKDTRTGRTTTRVDQVLKGDLETVLD